MESIDSVLFALREMGYIRTSETCEHGFSVDECVEGMCELQTENALLRARHNALVEAVHGAMGRTVDCDKKQTNEQLVSDIIYLKRLLTEAQTRNDDISSTLTNIKVHFDKLCSEDIRVHGFISPDHDIDFQVFRLLCGYKELLDWQKESVEALRFYAAEDKESVNDGILGSVYDRPATKILEKK
jgi:hypothetical protein